MIALSTTSADGAMMTPARRPKVIRVLPSAMGTSSNIAWPADFTLSSATQATSSVEAAPERASTAARIFELRRLSGLTWDSLAQLFGVSRRAAHFWASGKPMTAANEERLRGLLATLRTIDRGSGAATCAALLQPSPTGERPFDLLAAARFERVLELVGPGPGAARSTARTPLSAEAQRARAPRPPGDLAAALQDSVHMERGRLLASKPIRKPRGG